MSILDFFKRKNKAFKYEPSKKEIIKELEENGYPVSIGDGEWLHQLYSVLNDKQKSAIIMVMHSFCSSFIIRESGAGELADNLMKLKSEFVGVSVEQAQQAIGSPDILLNTLASINTRRVLDILLSEMQFLLELVVGLTIRYRDGADVNRQAVNALYGIFLPLGYRKEEIFKHERFLMY